MKMEPYYSDDLVTIFNCDSREILPMIEFDSLITDPVWPNAKANLYGKDDPFLMLKSILDLTNYNCKRIAIHLGCDSDPRFLNAVPERYKYFRSVSLEYVQPCYKGRLLNGGDIAYLFGEVPPSKKGQMVIPGRYVDRDSNGKQTKHPCPRKLNHAKWLIKWWTSDQDIVCDPCSGSGTTLLAARILGRKSIGIEYEKSFCDMAIERFNQQEMNLIT